MSFSELTSLVYLFLYLQLPSFIHVIIPQYYNFIVRWTVDTFTKYKKKYLIFDFVP